MTKYRNEDTVSLLPRGRTLRTGAVRLPAPTSAALKESGAIQYKWVDESITEKGHGRYREIRITTNFITIPRNLWSRFRRLAAASDKDICKFAARYGPLSVGPGLLNEEPLSTWRTYTRLSNAILNCGIALREEELGSDDDWRTICEWLGPYYEDFHVAERREYGDEFEQQLARRAALAMLALNRWYARASDHQLVSRLGQSLVIAPSSHSLLGAIAVQIAAQLTAATELTTCSACGQSYKPKRKTVENRRHYCADCKKRGIDLRDAKRDSRRRQAEEKQMSRWSCPKCAKEGRTKCTRFHVLEEDGQLVLRCERVRECGWREEIVRSPSSRAEQVRTSSTKLFRRMASEDDLRPGFRRWTGNDASGRHHHGKVSLNATPLDLRLEWKNNRNSERRLVGFFRLHLDRLLKHGYIRTDAPGSVRLRFIHDDGSIYIQARRDSPRLLVAKLT